MCSACLACVHLAHVFQGSPEPPPHLSLTAKSHPLTSCIHREGLLAATGNSKDSGTSSSPEKSSGSISKGAASSQGSKAGAVEKGSAGSATGPTEGTGGTVVAEFLENGGQAGAGARGSWHLHNLAVAAKPGVASFTKVGG